MIKNMIDVENLSVYLIFHDDFICGGMMSIFSMAKTSRELKDIHNSEVILMTLPNKNNRTYHKQINFKNEEMIYRFNQITKLKKLKRLTINVPEMCTVSFYNILTNKQKEFLKNLEEFKINILNQNIQGMPEIKEFEGLYTLTDKITQTIAHSRYATQEICNRYQLPALLMPGYTDLSAYPKTRYKDKENIIAYSLDPNPVKEEVLVKLKNKFPDFRFFEVRDITFNEYIELVTKAKFTITFGEGFDGYLIWPVRQGSIGFSAYNDELFPNPEIKNYINMFESDEDMLNNITNVLERLNDNPQEYDESSKAFDLELDKYPEARANDFEFHKGRIKRFYLNDFDFYPQQKGN